MKVVNQPFVRNAEGQDVLDSTCWESMSSITDVNVSTASVIDDQANVPRAVGGIEVSIQRSVDSVNLGIERDLVGMAGERRMLLRYEVSGQAQDSTFDLDGKHLDVAKGAMILGHTSASARDLFPFGMFCRNTCKHDNLAYLTDYLYACLVHPHAFLTRGHLCQMQLEDLLSWPGCGGTSGLKL